MQSFFMQTMKTDQTVQANFVAECMFSDVVAQKVKMMFRKSPLLPVHGSKNC